jgi:SAM-dependent methyltransferase
LAARDVPLRGPIHDFSMIPLIKSDLEPRRPMKVYDQTYFNRWYRDPGDRVSTRESLVRKVRMAVSVTEFLLGREIRSVLDVGCGEAPWFRVLKRLRPKARYVGVDSSEYVVERFGDERNIRQGSLGTLNALKSLRRSDLVVCADVLQYVETRDVERGLRAIRKLLGGVAYVEAFTTEDEMEGDRVDWHERSAAEYRRLFRRAGLTQCGPYCYTNLDELDSLNSFEHA